MDEKIVVLQEELDKLELYIKKLNTIFSKILSPAGIITAVIMVASPLVATAYSYGILNNRVVHLEEVSKSLKQLNDTLIQLQVKVDDLDESVDKLSDRVELLARDKLEKD